MEFSGLMLLNVFAMTCPSGMVYWHVAQAQWQVFVQVDWGHDEAVWQATWGVQQASGVHQANHYGQDMQGPGQTHQWQVRKEVTIVAIVRLPNCSQCSWKLKIPLEPSVININIDINNYLACVLHVYLDFRNEALYTSPTLLSLFETPRDKVTVKALLL